MSSPLSGVLPAPTGSEVRRRFGINNGDMNALLSQQGIEAIREVTQTSIRSGATLGVSSTYRATPFRGHNTGWDFHDSDRFELPEYFAQANRTLVHIARESYGSVPVFGNIAPTTNTSRSPDDQHYAQIGGGSAEARKEFSRQRQDAQIAVLAEAGVNGILVEACRHPDDAAGIARSVRDRVRRSSLRYLIVSFEAENLRVPDPIHLRDGYTFGDMKGELQQEVGSEVQVLIGANCIGASAIREIVQSGQSLDIAYPNEADIGTFDSSAVLDLFGIFGEVQNPAEARHLALESLDRDGHSTLVEDLRIALGFPDPSEAVSAASRILAQNASTSPEALQAVWRECLQSGVRIIGICCGGQPHHVEAARRSFDAFGRADEL
ncbi:MAG: homocysteine S-methyltransferase family protein [Patescibacteria group bacterium]